MSIQSIYNKDETIIVVIEDVLEQEELDELTKWLSQLKYYGEKSYTSTVLDRSQIWFHKEEKPFNINWKKDHERWRGHAYLPELEKFEKQILKTTQNLLKSQEINLSIEKINSCLVNRYLDGNQFIRPHRDSEQAFGEQPTIIGFSVGDTRTLKLESKAQETMSYLLKPNSIFIMAGRSQMDWTHSIPLEPERNDVRYSLTFRHHLQ